MQTSSKKQLRKLIAALLFLFVLLFLFRLAYGYTKTINNHLGQTQFFESASSTKRNYASKKHEIKSSSQAAVKVDQKYEKIAEISTQSTTFDTEEKEARSKVASYQALIQFEQKSGNKGYRKLNLLIGVPPENFDALYQDLIAIGSVQAKQITKKDKTNEYKELNARKASLEKIRNSLLGLKQKEGRIDEYMQLENRILEIEQQLQDLGVSLGDFDVENEFCTVQFSLLEGRDVKISFLHRVKVALEWTIKFYLRMIAILCFLTLFAYLTVLIIDKVKHL